MLTFALWLFFLLVALFVLVRGADLFVEGARQVGEALGMSRFAIGVIMVGFGTSLPELSSAFAATIHGATDIAIGNAIGANITNILLIIGILAALGGPIVIKRDLVKAELPVFFIATALFFMVMADGTVDKLEALFLLGTFGAYLWYLFTEASAEDSIPLLQPGRRPLLEIRSIVFVVLGIAAVFFGATYTIDMVTNIATYLKIPAGLIAISVIALGTTLPELSVSLRALKRGEAELAIGNIFGSITFNLLVVIGAPAFLVPLHADPVIMDIGLPVLLVSSGILFVAGLSKHIMRWEGFMLIMFYAFFIVKLTAFCAECIAAGGTP